MKRGILWAIVLSLFGVGGAWSVYAATFNSSNFSINGNLGDSAAGGQSSTNYNLVSATGESIAGQSSSTSYKLGQGYTSLLEQSLQLSVQPSNQQLYMPFDEGSGASVYDESSNSFNSSLTGTPTWTTGKVGGALTFDGTTNSVSVPNNAALSNYSGTLSAWVKTSLTTGTQAVLQKSSNYTLAVNANKAAIYDWNTSSFCQQSTTGFANGAWHHIAMTYQSGVTNGSILYVDGIAVQTCTMTFVNQSNPLIIGDNGASNQKFQGQIDEPKVYNRVFSAAEVKAEYDAGVAGTTAGLGFGSITPGTSKTNNFNTIVQTDAPGYNLAVNRNRNLQDVTTGTPDFSQDFNSFSNAGTTLTTANTGFDAFNASGSATFTTATGFTPVQSTYARASTTTTSTFIARDDYAVTADRYYRFYMRFGTTPASPQTVFSLRNTADTVVMGVRLGADGKLTLRDAAVGVATSTRAINAGEWFRVELFYNSSSSTQTMRLFYGDNLNSPTPSETLSGSASNGTTDDMQIGILTSQANQDLDMDEVGTSLDTWLGPPSANPIPAVTSSIASPVAWSEGTTKGLGFSIATAPSLDGKWGSGANYAAFPLSGTTFYSRSGYTGGTKDVLGMRLRLDVSTSQPTGNYSSNMVITGTITP